MARCGQISRSAANFSSLPRQMTGGMPKSVWAFMLPDVTSEESSAGYQNPVNGAPTAAFELDSLWDMVMDMEETD